MAYKVAIAYNGLADTAEAWGQRHGHNFREGRPAKA